MSILKVLFLIMKSILLTILLRVSLKLKKLKLKIKNLKENGQMVAIKEKKKTSKSLPDFPPLEQISRNQIGGAETPEGAEKKGDSIPGTSEDIESEDIEEICKDVVSGFFEIWAILKPGVPPLSETEKKLIKKPLARIVIKYDVARFMKDEFLLIGLLGFSVLKRLKVKKDVNNDRREEGQRKDDLSEKPDITAAIQ